MKSPLARPDNDVPQVCDTLLHLARTNYHDTRITRY